MHWHIPVNPRYHHFLAVQVDECAALHSPPVFGLSSAPRIFIEMTRPLGQALSSLGVKIMLDDWLTQVMDRSLCEVYRDIIPDQTYQMGFLFCLTIFHLTPTQITDWSRMAWDSSTSTPCVQS